MPAIPALLAVASAIPALTMFQTSRIAKSFAALVTAPAHFTYTLVVLATAVWTAIQVAALCGI